MITSCKWMQYGIAYSGTKWVSAFTEAIYGDQRRCCYGVTGGSYSFVTCVLHVLHGGVLCWG